MRIIRAFFFSPPRQFCVLLVRTFVRAQPQQCAFSSRHKGRLFRRIREIGLFRRAGGRRQERNGQRCVDFAARVIERCCRCRSKKVVGFFAVVVVVVWLSAAGLIGRRDGIPRGMTVHLCSADSRLARASVARFLI